MSGSWQGGSTGAWRKLRKQILDRDRYRCQLQLPPTCDCTIKDCKRFHGCTTIADCVHHTEGIEVTGNNPKYLIASCTPCNLHLGKPGRTTKDPQISIRTQW